MHCEKKKKWYIYYNICLYVYVDRGRGREIVQEYYLPPTIPILFSFGIFWHIWNVQKQHKFQLSSPKHWPRYICINFLSSRYQICQKFMSFIFHATSIFALGRGGEYICKSRANEKKFCHVIFSELLDNWHNLCRWLFSFEGGTFSASTCSQVTVHDLHRQPA